MVILLTLKNEFKVRVETTFLHRVKIISYHHARYHKFTKLCGESEKKDISQSM